MYTSRSIKIFFAFIVLIIIGITKTNAQSSVLDKYISVEKSSGSTDELLNEIEYATDIIFSYSNKLCLCDSIVLSSSRNTIKGFLHEIFSDCEIDITLRKKKIIILPKDTETNKKFVISGFIKNIETDEILIGASVYDALLWEGTNSNNFGFYSLTLPRGNVVLNSSFVGYHTVQHSFTLDKDTTINFNLLYNTHLKEVPIVGYIAKEGINTSRTSTVNVPVEQIQKFPSFLGEVDVIKTLQLLPGINSGNEGVSGLFVRGGGVDQKPIFARRRSRL